MSEMTDLITFLRASGVERFSRKAESFDVSFFPAAKDQRNIPASPLQVDDEERCNCGHPLYNHGDAGCKLGCHITTCVPVADRKHEDFPNFIGEDEVG